MPQHGIKWLINLFCVDFFYLKSMLGCMGAVKLGSMCVVKIYIHCLEVI